MTPGSTVPSFPSHRPHLPNLACVLVMLLAALLMFRRPLFSDEALYFRDLQIFFAPMKHFLATMLAGGAWPLWNPSLQMGSPFLADPQSGVFYPPSLLFLFFDAVRGMAVSLAFHLWLAQLGLFVLARHYGFGRVPALAGALAYALGGWMISSANMLTLAHSAAWLPWTLLVFERLWQRQTAGRLASAATVLALQMLAGWPEMLLMIALILMARRLALPGLLEKRWLQASLLTALIAAALVAPQALASWEAFAQSMRVGGMSEALLFEFSATAGQWRSLLFPPALATDNWNILAAYPDGHVPIFLSLYLGWVALVMVAASLFGPRRHLAVWLGLLAGGVFLALGETNPLAMSLLRQVNIFRSPEKYLFLVHLGACMLLVAGCARLLAAVPSRLVRPSGVALLLALGGELLYVNGRINLLAPPGYYNLTQSEEARIIQAAPGRVYALAGADADKVRDLYAGFRKVLTPNLGMMAGTGGQAIGYVNGVSFLQLRADAAALDLLNVPPGAVLARRLGFLGVRWVVSDNPAFTASAEWRRMARQHTTLLWQLQESAPWLGLAASVVAVPDSALASYSAHPDLTRGEVAVVAPGDPLTGGQSSGELQLGRVAPGHVEALVMTPTGALVVLRESFYPGWQARIDGEPAPLVRVNRFFMGVVVPAGSHRIHFDYRPTYWTLGWLLAGTALLVLAALSAVAFKQRKRPANGVARG